MNLQLLLLWKGRRIKNPASGTAASEQLADGFFRQVFLFSTTKNEFFQLIAVKSVQIRAMAIGLLRKKDNYE